jgi:hypothetical protein
MQQAWTISVLLLAVAVLPQSLRAATLADLFNGGSLIAGNTRFSNWQLISFDATASQSPLLSQITVLPMVNDLTRPGLSYSGNGQLATSGINAIDFTFSYRVQALYAGKAYVNQAQSLTSVALGTGDGLAYLSQEVADLAGTSLGATLTMADNGSGFFQTSDEQPLSHRFGLKVTTNIFLTGISTIDTVNLASFTQRFTQTGLLSPAGDFDVDGDVDGRDFLVWQRGGSPTPLSLADRATWQSNYGAVAALAPTLTSIPEPSALLLMMFGAVIVSTSRRPT